ncbi:Crp/Fnr family transcriptional regulator [Caulobacter sp. Root1455]|jgi:CRP/FNR family nitrogen fixation transcriptional regulator|uniref:helix-turn-helix domain-containing protein n=1 Tax=unclassified Caulobacter TaxID=2648921 RepID=UPI0006FC8EA6|nr:MULTISPECIES: helix-turn-helix domain-containing protein [unclassified Caulobacter]KQY29959.1 Crp/Fnr family transcriptional regulator [Caulobacter sp. Root487D2Y]KQY92258.1 Crp/Fnr family transcriptional regulator [Caulobacter sp. Root1455]
MTPQANFSDRGRIVPLTANLADPFQRLGGVLRFAVGEEIYAQEEEADLIYRVVSGAVRATRLLSDGRRQISDFYFPGDLFGLEIGLVHRAAAEALGDVEVLVVKRRALKLLGEDGVQLERMIWQATGEHLERAHDHMLLLGRKSACEKVACFLSDISDRCAAPWAVLPMSRQDIADYLGLTIETVSRMVTQLQQEGLVEFDGCRRFRIAHRARLSERVAA